MISTLLQLALLLFISLWSILALLSILGAFHGILLGSRSHIGLLTPIIRFFKAEYRRLHKQ